MDISILKKLGLSEKEIKVYLTLLENGAMAVRKVAEAAELNRGTTYDVLKDLQKMGLVSFYHTETKQKFIAENPGKLLKVLSDRREELEHVQGQIENIIPELKSLQDKEGNRPVTKFYEGKEGIKFILDDVLAVMRGNVASGNWREKDMVNGNENSDGNATEQGRVAKICVMERGRDAKFCVSTEKEYYVYSASGVREDIYAAYPDFSKKRIKTGIKVKTISLSRGGDTYGLDERKWLETNEETPTYILIYNNKCAFIARDMSNNPVGVIIENKMIYETQKAIFLKMWEMIE